MNENNICKFVPYENFQNLTTSNFVYETNEAIFSDPYQLHTHRMILVASGSSEFHFSSSVVNASFGNILLGFEGEVMTIKNARDLTYFYICFSGDRSDGIFERFGISKDNRLFGGFEKILPIWKESLIRADKKNLDLIAESMLLYAFSQFNCPKQSDDSLSSKMIALAQKHFTDPTLNISAIGKLLNYNPKYLSHIFVKQRNIPFSDYLQNTRIQYAISLMENGIDSIKNIALLSGFSDAFYFSSVFKKHTHKAPSEYIKDLRKK